MYGNCLHYAMCGTDRLRFCAQEVIFNCQRWRQYFVYFFWRGPLAVFKGNSVANKTNSLWIYSDHISLGSLINHPGRGRLFIRGQADGSYGWWTRKCAVCHTKNQMRDWRGVIKMQLSHTPYTDITRFIYICTKNMHYKRVDLLKQLDKENQVFVKKTFKTA